jgi:hypothetical protein
VVICPLMAMRALGWVVLIATPLAVNPARSR